MSAEKHIIIAGGGFAGTTLMRTLDSKLPAGYRLLLISEESHTTFNPMLPEAVGASIFPEQVVAPIREMITHARFVMGRVKQVERFRDVQVNAPSGTASEKAMSCSAARSGPMPSTTCMP